MGRGRRQCDCGKCRACNIRAGIVPPPYPKPEKPGVRRCRCGGDVFRIIGPRGGKSMCRAQQCIQARELAREQGTSPKPRPGGCTRCNCGECAACLKRLRAAQQASDRRADEINQAAVAAGAEPSKHRPRVTGLCQCGASIFGKIYNRADKCSRCSLIARTKKDVSKYFESLTESEPTARRLYQPIDDAEIAVLALCEADSDAQLKMDAIIRRECARIRLSWDEEEHHKRAGKMMEDEVSPPLISDFS